jgi:CheY-like chemotaxis protein
MAKKTILVLDDDGPIRLLVGGILESKGYSVSALGDGREAVRVLRDTSFSLLITDLFMPEKDGLEVIREVRMRHPGLPIIAISGGGGHPKGELLKVARHMGAHAVMEKPFTAAQLFSAIEAQIGGPED